MTNIWSNNANIKGITTSVSPQSHALRSHGHVRENRPRDQGNT